MRIGRRTSDAFTLAPRDDARPDPRRERAHVLTAVPFSCVERAPPRRPRRLRRARHLPRSRCPRRQDGFLPRRPPLLVVRAADEEKPLGVFKLEYDISNDLGKSSGWKEPLVIAVSGAAGQIGNHLLFKIASGEVYGQDQPIALRLLGSERSREALEGVAMELEDSLFPLLREVNIGIDPKLVFENADWALLIGAKPRGPGMERSDLLEMNGQIFVEQGKALNEVAKPTCKVCVVGNPCNTNALIAMENAPNLDRKNFHALTRLDENAPSASWRSRRESSTRP